MKKHVLSGIRATGRMHLGNYLGAVKGMLELQDNDEYETLYMVADVHTITTPYIVPELRRNRREIFIDYLAAGLDPAKSILFLQSMVPQHLELAFYFATVTTVAKMQHLPTFKDKVKQHPQHVMMALLSYPNLMSADILVYKAGLVPVGIDQEPHLEITREIARRMNDLYGTDFPEPKRFTTKGEYVPSLTGAGKMSKTLEGSYINLLDTAEVVKKKMRGVPTATQAGGTMSDGIKTLFAFADIYLPDDIESLKKQFEAGSLQFGAMKDAIAEQISAQLAPYQEKRAEIENKSDYIDEMMLEGATRAGNIAQKTILEVREKMGLA